MLKHWRTTHCLDGCSPILVNGSDLLKHLRATHFLDGCSPNLVSGSELLKHWRATHFLDGCSPNLISGSDLRLLNCWRETHCLDGCSPIPIRRRSDQTLKSNSLAGSMFMHFCQLFCSNIGELLTFCVHPFFSAVLFYLNIESDSQPECMSSRSC